MIKKLFLSILITLTSSLTGCSLLFVDGSGQNNQGGNTTDTTKENNSDNKGNNEGDSSKTDDKTTPGSDTNLDDPVTPVTPVDPISSDTYKITFYYYDSLPIGENKKVFTTRNVKFNKKLDYEDFYDITSSIFKIELPSPSKEGYYWHSSFEYEIINECPVKGNKYDTSLSTRYSEEFPTVNYDIDIIPSYSESLYSYETNFLSHEGEKLFSFSKVAYGSKVTEKESFETTYFDPVYSVNGKRYLFKGWSTNKNASPSQAISINDLVVKTKEPYYAIYDTSNYDSVFIEVEKTLLSKANAFTFEEAKAKDLVKINESVNGTLSISDLYEIQVLNTVVSSIYNLRDKAKINVYFSASGASAITSISSSCFKRQSNIEYVDFGNVTSISSSAFEESGITRINAPKVKSIGTSSFMNCTTLSDFDFPALESIDMFSFRGCKEITTVDLSSTKIPKLSYGVFKDCTKLTSVKIPNTITDFASEYAQDQRDTQSSLPQFDNCPNLKSITIASNSNSVIRSENNCIIDSSNRLLYMAQGATIPSSVKTIATGAINYQSGKSITIPTSVTLVEPSAFKRCLNLETVNFAGSKDTFKNMCSHDIDTFYDMQNRNDIVLKYSSNLSSSIKMSDLFK